MDEVSVLSEKELARLEGYEETIRKGVATFIEVGLALWHVREERLYLDYGTFEDYLQKKWLIGRSYAYHLMASAQAVADVVGVPIDQLSMCTTVHISNPEQNSSTQEQILPTSERQARALVPVPPEHRQEVFNAAVEAAGGQPTAAQIQTSAAEILPSRSDALPNKRPEPTKEDRQRQELAEQQTIAAEAKARREQSGVSSNAFSYVNPASWNDDFSRHRANFIGVTPAIPARDFPERHTRYSCNHKILTDGGWHHRLDEPAPTAAWICQQFSQEEQNALFESVMAARHQPAPVLPPAQLTIEDITNEDSNENSEDA